MYTSGRHQEKIDYKNMLCSFFFDGIGTAIYWEFCGLYDIRRHECCLHLNKLTYSAPAGDECRPAMYIITYIVICAYNLENKYVYLKLVL